MKLTLAKDDGTAFEEWDMPGVNDVSDLKHLRSSVDDAVMHEAFCECDGCDKWFIPDDMIEKPNAVMYCAACAKEAKMGK